MHLKLKVLRGASAGKEVPVKVPRFFIGRSEECQLRINSDAISRKHCAITLENGIVTIRDLGSRNGTHVNGQRIDGVHAIQMGDQLRIGPLEFLVTYVQSAKAVAKPKASDSVAATDDDMAGLIDGWLSEAGSDDATGRRSAGETREFRLDETSRIDRPSGANGEDQAAREVKEVPEHVAAQDEAVEQEKPEQKPERSPVLPTGRRTAPKPAPKDTQEAAAQTLRKFFNRGG